jgi:hypothetical protein
MIALFAALALTSTAPQPSPFNFGPTPLEAQLAEGKPKPPNLGDLLFGAARPNSLPIKTPELTLGRLKRCASGYTQLTAAQRKAKLGKLADLPDADMEIAVNRVGLDGCPARTVAAYKVSR